MYQLLLTTFFIASVLAAGPISLPSTFKLCSRSDPNFNDCLKSAVQSSITTNLAKGVRSLGVLPLDPLQILSLRINQGTGPVTVSLEFKDFAINGMSKLVVESVNAHLTGDVKTLSIKVKTDDIISLVGKYDIAGKILVLPISGSGDSEIKIFGASATITFTGPTIVKNGVTYLIFESGSLDLNPKIVSFHYDNLFNGDKALGDNMNKVLNENWAEIYGEMKDPVQKALITTFIEITNRIFSKVPYDKIFLS